MGLLSTVDPALVTDIKISLFLCSLYVPTSTVSSPY